MIRAQLSFVSLVGSVLPALHAEGLRLNHSLVLTNLTATGQGQDGGVRLPGAHITGLLDLRGAELTNHFGPALHADRLQVDSNVLLAGLTAIGHGDGGGVRLLGARITGLLDLRGAELTNHFGPALHADRLQVDNEAFLTNLTATGHGKDGAVRLPGAHITGQLDLRGAKLTNHGGPALSADGLQVGSNALLADLTATGQGKDGAVRLPGAHITGQLDLRGAKLTNHGGPAPTNDTGPALHADGLQVDSNALLAGLTAIGHAAVGTVRLMGAHITGLLDLRGAELTNHFGPALHADRLQVDSNALLAGLTATGHGKDGGVRLLGAHITGQLDLRGAELTNHFGPALHADGLQVGSSARLADLQAIGHGDMGGVRLLGAHITGQLDLRGAELTNHFGPALNADRLQVGSNARLADLTATGHGDMGGVRLLGAHITGQLNLRGAKLTNHGGPALSADRLQVDNETFLTNLTATGHGKDGAVRLPGAHITGQLNLRGAKLTNHGGPAPTNDTGPALHADGLQVGTNAWLTGLTATGHGQDGAVRLHSARITGQLAVSGQVTNHGGQRVILDLRDARVDGALSLWNESAWRGMLDGSDTAKTRPRLLLDGFTYRAQPRQPGAGTWLRVLRECMTSHAPQPYRQLADVCRGAGDEERAKKVLIAQQDAFGKALDKEDAPRRGARLWHWIARVTVRYGYRSGRALWFLLVVMVISCGLILFADTQGWLVHPKARGGWSLQRGGEHRVCCRSRRASARDGRGWPLRAD
ncbi:hypothetical protein OG851_43500 (plasmid) [Streptomyces sp. NBC_00161]|uniref:hypothetical protein n=1 Tax=Streptomyces sp. NBC_00161 TaxID=2975671 RepID=UPI0032524403